MLLLYFLIALIASLIGALAGLGGGMIIKPLLDLLNHFDAQAIGILSSLTVFSMSVVTLSIQTVKGARLRGAMLYIATGAALGGMVGKSAFRIFMSNIGSDNLAKGYQALLLLLVLVFSLLMSDIVIESKHLHNPLAYGASGLLLGILSTFLGIGGGPLNVAMLVTLFSMPRRDAVYSSIFIIFASQGVGLISGALSGIYMGMDFRMAFALIPGGVFGGLLGSALYRHLKIDHIMVVFNAVTLGIILLSIFNAWQFFNAF